MATELSMPVGIDVNRTSLDETLDALQRPIGVQEPRVTYGIDHSGDPSVWIVFPVSTELKLTNQRIKVLNKFAEGVRSKLRELRIPDIAYVRFTETDVHGTRG